MNVWRIIIAHIYSVASITTTLTSELRYSKKSPMTIVFSSLVVLEKEQLD